MQRRIAILFNERAGRGRAGRIAASACESLQRGGHEVETVRIGEYPPVDCEALIVLGGDGTLHHTLPLAIERDLPLYHAPLGTENLIPREFGFTASPEAIAGAVGAWSIRRVDVGDCGGVPFAIMASAGFDAEVIHRVHAERPARIRRATYLVPIMRELLAGPSAPLSITIDGEPLVRSRRGVAIVANCRQYGFRFNPACDASMTDGLLDVVFMPADTPHLLIAWAVRARLGRLMAHPLAIHARAEAATVEIERAGGGWQVDGEPYRAALHDSPSTTLLEFGVRRRALSLLLPAVAPALS